MAISKRRLNWQRLQKQPALKKEIALFIAEERMKDKKNLPDIKEVLAFGYKERPLLAHSEKDLVKMFDEIATTKVEEIERLQKEMLSEENQHQHKRWRREEMKTKIERLNKELEAMQPITTALIEEAFSE